MRRAQARAVLAAPRAATATHTTTHALQEERRTVASISAGGEQRYLRKPQPCALFILRS